MSKSFFFFPFQSQFLKMFLPLQLLDFPVQKRTLRLPVVLSSKSYFHGTWMIGITQRFFSKGHLEFNIKYLICPFESLPFSLSWQFPTPPGNLAGFTNPSGSFFPTLSLSDVTTQFIRSKQQIRAKGSSPSLRSKFPSPAKSYRKRRGTDTDPQWKRCLIIRCLVLSMKSLN